MFHPLGSLQESSFNPRGRAVVAAACISACLTGWAGPAAVLITVGLLVAISRTEIGKETS